MFTIESFCNAIWETSYAKVSLNILKDDYSEFEIPKKDGKRKISYLNKDSGLWSLQHKLLINFLNKQDLPVCVKGFKKAKTIDPF